ncbi:unnamed protein product [Polarella glacialis]|uniref:Uncharacterized protein n=1 Tax=Polarella glacialis TaxID=89957 RepID=A0A813FLN3_POLGL|nr:unnamed protein product [Polarella glacialis]CAE8718035.1 unnamed protein product [Polarella glacialis]
MGRVALCEIQMPSQHMFRSWRRQQAKKHRESEILSVQLEVQRLQQELVSCKAGHAEEQSVLRATISSLEAELHENTFEGKKFTADDMECVVAYSSSNLDEMYDAQLHQLVGQVETLQNEVAEKEDELLRRAASPTQVSSILPRSADGVAAAQPTAPDVALSPTSFLGLEDVGALRCASSKHLAVGFASNSVASSSSSDVAGMCDGTAARADLHRPKLTGVMEDLCKWVDAHPGSSQQNLARRASAVLRELRSCVSLDLYFRAAGQMPTLFSISRIRSPRDLEEYGQNIVDAFMSFDATGDLQTSLPDL